ncbi:MAG: polyhydroxyalkanoic acid system family protein [Pirellulaceae bacterium]
MLAIESQIPHQLGRSVAAERMHELVASLSQRFPQQVHQVQLHLDEHRVDVSFAAYGYKVEWEAEINETCIILHGRIPDSAKPFRNKIEQAILARVEATLLPNQTRAA